MKNALATSATKTKLLEAAQQLMLAKGFNATSLEDICKTAAVTKGSFFHYFSNKEELGQAVLAHYMSGHIQAMQAAPFGKKRDPLARVFGHIDFIVKMSSNPETLKGCLLGGFSQDLCGTHPAIGASCGGYFAQWAALMENDLKAAKQRYAPRAKFDTKSLADHFIAVIEGALILVKAKQDGKILGEQMRHFKRYVESLFSPHRVNRVGARRV